MLAQVYEIPNVCTTLATTDLNNRLISNYTYTNILQTMLHFNQTKTQCLTRQREQLFALLMKQKARKEKIARASKNLLLSLTILLCITNISKAQSQAPQSSGSHHHPKNHQCSRAHFYKHKKQEKLLQKANQWRASKMQVAKSRFTGAKMNRKGTAVTSQQVGTIAPAGPNGEASVKAVCQYTASQMASLNSSDLVSYLTSNSDYDCVGRPLFDTGSHLSSLFSNTKMQAVFQAIYNRSASYDGTFSSGMYGLLIYMHTAAYHEFFSPNDVALNATSKTLYGQALESLSSNSHLFDVNAEALPMLQEFLINIDYEGVRHKTSSFSVVKTAMRNLTIYDTWKPITDSQVLRAYAAAYNSIFFLMFRGSGTAQGGDSNFWTAVDNDAQFTSLLAGIGKDAELLANDNFAFMVNNAVLELTRMAHIPGVITQIESDLAAIVNLYPRLEIKWFRSIIALNKYGNCATYSLCENEDALKEELNKHLFPNTYSFDDGKLLVKTPLSYKKVQELYHAAKEVQSQLFKMLQTDQPVTGDVNEKLNMVVFGSKSQYEDYATYLYGIPTDNGGMYIEKGATFYTWDRTVGIESSLSLESLFRHEYCHYLQGRYLVPGYWGENAIYDNSRLVWYEEGMAEFFAGATATDGLKILESNVGVVRSLGNGWPSLSTVFASSYTSGNYYHYHYGNMAWYNWYVNDFGTLKTFFDLTRNNDVAGFDNLVNSLKSSGESQYQNFLSQVNNGTINGKEPGTAWLNDIQFVLGNAADVKTEFTNVTGMSNVTASLDASLINKRFRITGSITGQGTANNNATAAQSTGDALNQLLKDLRNNSNVNNLDYSIGYLTNVTFSGGTPKADFVITGPLRNPNVSDDAVANFTAGSRAILAGDPVQFNDKSTGQLSSWNWNFNGGSPSTSNVPNPAVTYHTVGTYNVSLTAASSNGTNNTDSRNQYIKVYAKSNATYCAATMTNDYSFIRRVQFANIDHSTEGYPTATSGYSDFSSVLTELTQGQSYQLTVTPEYTNSDNTGVGVWIDWNQDGDFADAGEEVMMLKGRMSVAQANIQVPNNAILNTATRMRIRLNYSTGQNPTACGVDSYMGEVEDYSVVVINGTVAGQPPVASFSSDINYIIRSQSINFENTSAGNPTSVSWEFPGGSPATSTANNPTISYATDGIFPVIMTVENASGRDKTIAYVSVGKGGGIDGEYCTTSNDRDDVYIDKVQLNTIDNTTAYSTNGYGDYTAQSTVLARNTNYTITVSASKPWSYNTVRAWVDWNHDGDFNDDGERILDASGASTPYSASIVVPATAKEGGTRMRVRLAYSVDAIACGSGGIGETEDYIVYVGQETLIANFIADKTTITAGESVTFSDASSGNPTSYNWTFGGGSPNNSSAQSPTITYNTAGTYQVSLTATNAAGSNTKTVSAFITVTSVACTYCTASSNRSSYEHIAGVKVGNFNNTSTAANYTDFTNQTITLNAGADNSIELTPGYSGSAYGEYFRVWIDYNGDCDFDDPGEQVYTSGSVTTTVTGTIAVPAGTQITTRMRIAMRYNSAASACGTFSDGEVEDYTVNIVNDGTPLPTGYCSATAQQTGSEHITQVQFGNINNTSVSSGYGDYTSMSATIAPGTSQSITVTPSASWASSKLSIWVDWNGDKDFDDAGEVTVINGAGPYTTTLAAPSNAAIGVTRMRIRLSYGGSLSTACGDGWTGEVEDYTISVSNNAAARATTGVRDNKGDVSVYPNPTPNGIFMISLPQNIRLAENAKVLVKVLDLRGNVMHTFTTNRHQDNFRLNNLAKGVYMLRIVIGEQTYTKRLMFR